MMPFFNQTGLERVGVVGPEPGLLWTYLKALDRLAGDRTEVRLLQCWSSDSGRGTPLQKQERRGVGEGFARGRSDA